MIAFHHVRSALGAAWLSSLVALTGCTKEAPPEDPKPSAFSLKFAATANGKEVGCTDEIAGVGADGKQTIGLSDLRFYVSNLQLLDSAGKPVSFTLDSNDFQYNKEAGAVALVDLTGNTEGSCGGTSIAFAEGTARTHKAVTGATLVSKVASLSFDVGVPQKIMKEVIATNTAESAPSPLNEMYWSWATGYRHFIFNFTVKDGAGGKGDGYVHIGSRDCGPPDGLALEDRDACTFVNTPKVVLAAFDLETDVVQIDLPALVKELDFIAPIYDPKTFEVIGQGPGVECHSSPMQPDCKPVFSDLGLDMTTGAADASSDKIFSVR